MRSLNGCGKILFCATPKKEQRNSKANNIFLSIFGFRSGFDKTDLTQDLIILYVCGLSKLLTTLELFSMEEATNCITGIQQVGIGVRDAAAAFNWYNKVLGLNVPVFDDVAQAKLMTPHTNGIIRERRAILAVNMAGGGGAEIWQSNQPLPIAPKTEPKIGDLGIFAIKYKSQSVAKFATANGLKTTKMPNGENCCWTHDPYGNAVQVVPSGTWFKPNESLAGGVVGVVIGVSDVEKSIPLYKDVIGLSEIVYDESGPFEDFEDSTGNFRRVLLRKEQSEDGAFTNLFGNVEVELVQSLDRTPDVIFEGRSWGDLGYIHVCFDVFNMEKLQKQCEKNGYHFTVDSANSFDMGEAAGRFSYIKDPDGTLIEFVETHKVPILKKIGWYINLKKRNMLKPLPNWMISTIGWGKVKPQS